MRYLREKVAIAEDPESSADQLRRLANQPEWMPSVAHVVAENPASPHDVLTQLSRHDDYFVRLHVALNSSLTEELRGPLLWDQNSAVRRAAWLADDLSMPFREYAAIEDGLLNVYRLKPLESEDPSAVNEELNQMIVDELAHPATLPFRLVAVVEDAVHDLPEVSLEEWCAAVGSNPSCDRQLLRLLARYPSSTVRRSVAGNVSAGKKVLAMLANDGDADVRLSVVENPTTPPKIRGLAFDLGLPSNYLESRSVIATIMDLFD